MCLGFEPKAAEASAPSDYLHTSVENESVDFKQFQNCDDLNQRPLPQSNYYHYT